MAALAEQIIQLESAIAAQETMRPLLGDAVVNVTVAALRVQLDTLRGPARSAASPSIEHLLTRLMPQELTDQARAEAEPLVQFVRAQEAALQNAKSQGFATR